MSDDDSTADTGDTVASSSGNDGAAGGDLKELMAAMMSQMTQLAAKVDANATALATTNAPAPAPATAVRATARASTVAAVATAAGGQRVCKRPWCTYLCAQGRSTCSDECLNCFVSLPACPVCESRVAIDPTTGDPMRYCSERCEQDAQTQAKRRRAAANEKAKAAERKEGIIDGHKITMLGAHSSAPKFGDLLDGDTVMSGAGVDSKTGKPTYDCVNASAEDKLQILRDTGSIQAGSRAQRAAKGPVVRTSRHYGFVKGQSPAARRASAAQEERMARALVPDLSGKSAQDRDPISAKAALMFVLRSECKQVIVAGLEGPSEETLQSHLSATNLQTHKQMNTGQKLVWGAAAFAACYALGGNLQIDTSQSPAARENAMNNLALAEVRHRELIFSAFDPSCYAVLGELSLPARRSGFLFAVDRMLEEFELCTFLFNALRVIEKRPSAQGGGLAAARLFYLAHWLIRLQTGVFAPQNTLKLFQAGLSISECTFLCSPNVDSPLFRVCSKGTKNSAYADLKKALKMAKPTR